MYLFADPEFWVLLAVAIFVVIVWKPIRRFVVGTLDERAMRIQGELDEARKLREEAEQLLADYLKKQREAASERRQRLAEERIAQAESKAIDEIRAAAVDVAIDAARRVIVSELDERRGAAILDTAIASLPQRLR
jgi:F-type H+-transporting ATPase subunit b